MISRRIPIALLAIALLASAAMAEEQSRQVAVTGKGEISVVPDKAALTMGVEMRSRELDAARQQVTRTVSDFLALTEKLKIDKKHVNTSQLTVRPEYEWNSTNRQRRLVGFYVARQIHVELTDLDKLGPLMERAADLGVNQVSGPRFGSSREKALHREALEIAAADARLNAGVLAAALGAELGPVRSIQADQAPLPPPVPVGRAMMAEAVDAEQTYEIGEMKFTASVSAVFDLVVNP